MIKIGQGYDSHRFKNGEYVIIGGVKIKSKKSIVAHSDGDVLLHSIADSILGASALGDIGIFFSDTDESNKDLDSIKIINFCLKKIKTA